MKQRKSIGFLIIWGFVMNLFMTACTASYSFTGASIPAEVKSINIHYFPNNATLVEPTLSQKFTDALRDKFVNETSLTLVNEGGDLDLEGSITDYKTLPVAIQGDDQAALNRLTITVEVSYTNSFDEKMSFDNKFTRYADYSSSSNLTAIQEQLIDEINTQLIEDIFNKAVINW